MGRLAGNVWLVKELNSNSNASFGEQSICGFAFGEKEGVVAKYK